MRRSLALALLAALLLPVGAEARKPRATLRVHLEANTNDGEVFSTPMQSPRTGKTLVIQKVATISEADVSTFQVYPAADGTFGILFHLNDHGKLALDTLSVERRGAYIYVFVNGRPAAELQVDRRITDGKLFLASGMTAKDIELMKKEWKFVGQKTR